MRGPKIYTKPGYDAEEVAAFRASHDRVRAAVPAKGYVPPAGHTKHLADHERAHPGGNAEVDHGKKTMDSHARIQKMKAGQTESKPNSDPSNPLVGPDSGKHPLY